MNVKKSKNLKADSFTIDGFALDITKGKKAEEMLKQTERKYRDAYSLLNGVMESPKDIVIFALDREYCYLAFNKNHQMTMEQIWGVKIEVGISMLTYIKDPSDREKAKVNFDRALVGEAFTIVEEYGDPSLNRLFYSSTYSPLKDAEGNIIGLTLILEDITSRKHAEMDLEKSREQFRLAVDGSHDGIWDWDVHNNNLYLSSRCKEMIGYEDREFQSVYSIIEDYIHPDDKQWVINDLKEYLELEASEFNIEFRLKHRNGNYIWVQARGKALRDEEGLAYRMAGSLTDITERKKSEIKIAEEAVRRRILIEQSSDGIVILDKDGKVFEANQKYAEMLGYSLEEVLSLHIWDWDTQFTRDELNDMRIKVDEKGDHFETMHRRKDGTLFDVEISSNAAMFGEQKLIFCVCRDVTERKRAEKELLHAKLEAESANRAKSQFIANMSHELRTPLTAVIGFSDILSMDGSGKFTEKELRYIDYINKSGKHLLEIINDILDLSKIEAGKMEIECENISIKELLDEIVTQMTPMASRKNISIRIDNETPNDYIFADRLKFKQIMYNLLSNAIKFTPDNGIVTVNATNNSNGIQISVTDTGIGIPEDKLNNIFVPFMQVDESNKRRHGGTGLGLSLVKQYVEMHNGNVWVKSEEGKGSTFKFTIVNQDTN
ncbi:MAG: hypothetical protein PWP14_2040 [Methanolobus sp.]|nr:hypothetical protein [Methanolobus sp.]